MDYLLLQFNLELKSQNCFNFVMAQLFYFIIQCPQSLPESAGEEIKIKIRKNKNILLKIYILYKFNLSIFLKMLMILNTYLDWQNLNIYV